MWNQKNGSECVAKLIKLSDISLSLIPFIHVLFGQ